MRADTVSPAPDGLQVRPDPDPLPQRRALSTGPARTEPAGRGANISRSGK